MDFVTGSTLHSGCRLCLLVRLTCGVKAPTPPRTTTTTTTTTRDRQAAVILPRYCQACWTEIMASHAVCWLHAGPAKLPVVTHDYHSWPLTTGLYNYDTLKENKWSDDWPYNVTSSNCLQGSLCVLTVRFPPTAANTDEGNHLSWKALLTKHTKSGKKSNHCAQGLFCSLQQIHSFSWKQTIALAFNLKLGLEQRWYEFSTTILAKQDKCTVFYSLYPLI